MQKKLILSDPAVMMGKRGIYPSGGHQLPTCTISKKAHEACYSSERQQVHRNNRGTNIESLAHRFVRGVWYAKVGRALRACTILLGLLLAAHVAVVPDAKADMTFVRSFITDMPGFDLDNPWGLTVDLLGNVFVADTNHHRIIKFNPNGNPLLKFGKQGSDEGQLYYPQAVAVDYEDGRVYVADTSNQRISVFDLNGKFLFKFGEEGSGPGQLLDPNGVAVDHNGHVYVTEGRNNRVSIFFTDGRFSASFGKYGTGPGQFQVPAGIAIDHDQYDFVFVTDTYGGRVEVFYGSGKYITEFGSFGTGKGQLYFPDEIAVTKGLVPGELHVWVAEASYPSRVHEFVRAKSGAPYVPGQEILSGYAALNQPHGVSVDGQGRLYVANTTEDDVYVYEDKAPELKAFSFSNHGRNYIIKTSGIWIALYYNQIDKMCDVLGNATVTVPLDPPVKFKIEGNATGVNRQTETDMKMEQSEKQLAWIKKAWDQGKFIKVVARFKGGCTDNVHVTEKIHFRK